MYDYLSVAAVLITVIGFCIQFGMFVRPVELEKKHREIMEESYKKFASIDMVQDIKTEFREIKCKIDQIYEILLRSRGENEKKNC